MKVELLTAWLWRCPECANVNAEEGMPMRSDEVDEVVEELQEDGEDLSTFDPEEWVTKPTRVMCNGCRATFNVSRSKECA